MTALNDTTDERISPTTLVNLRDVAAANPALAAGMLLRSDAPKTGDLPITAIATWPPRTVVDLRDAAEKTDAHPFAGHSVIVTLPLLEGSAVVRDELPSSLGELYAAMIAGHGAAQLVMAIEVIATHEPPVLVHCAAGKDRTGVTVALALRLAGIEREAIVADYALTTAAMPQVVARLAGGVHAVERFATVPPEMLTAPPEAIESLLEIVDGHPDGVVGWFIANGGEMPTVEALRRRLLLNSPV